MVARALVGTHLVHRHRVARIVETEAYRGPKDLACHARAGMTKRTRTLYGPPGHAYVFLIYGMYDCFNVVCFGEGKGHAVLDPRRRARRSVCRATCAATDRDASRVRSTSREPTTGSDLVASTHLYVAPRTKRPRIAVSARVGVAYAGEIAEAPWRFFDPTSTHVSRPSPRSIGLGG